MEETVTLLSLVTLALSTAFLRMGAPTMRRRRVPWCGEVRCEGLVDPRRANVQSGLTRVLLGTREPPAIGVWLLAPRGPFRSQGPR